MGTPSGRRISSNPATTTTPSGQRIISNPANTTTPSNQRIISNPATTTIPSGRRIVVDDSNRIPTGQANVTDPRRRDATPVINRQPSSQIKPDQQINQGLPTTSDPISKKYEQSKDRIQAKITPNSQSGIGQGQLPANAEIFKDTPQIKD